MFQNRISGFKVHRQQDPRSVLPLLGTAQASHLLPSTVPTADLYQAARNRAVHDHELDKLFNPDLYDDEI